MNNYSRYLSTKLPELLALPKGSQSNIIEIRAGSDSDFKKVKKELFDKLNEYEIPYILGVKSAHRTPEAMIESAKVFPKIMLPPDIKARISDTSLQVMLCIAIAGGSAHIAGMTASETSIPVMGLPVDSSAMGIIDGMLSMINMPPGIPNGYLPSQESAVEFSRRLFELKLDKGFNEVDIQEGYEHLFPEETLNEFGLKIGKGESPIKIFIQPIDGPQSLIIGNTKIPIIIPTVTKQITLEEMRYLANINLGGAAYMGLNPKEGIRVGNAAKFAAQIIGIFNPQVKKKVEDHSSSLTKSVLEIDRRLTGEQFPI